MKLFKALLLALTLPFMLSACIFVPSAADELQQILDAAQETPEVERKLSEKKYTGEKKYYYDDGKQLKTVIQYKDGYREGRAINYYKDGTICLDIEYKRGLKNGKYIWNYQSGKPYRVVYYTDDQLDGSYTEYQRNGDITFEANYSKGQPCTNFKHYDALGKRKKPIELVIEDKGVHNQQHQYAIRFKDEELNDVRFYLGGVEKGCFSLTETMGGIPSSPSGAMLEIPIEKGKIIDIDLDVVAIGSIQSGVEVAVAKKYHFFVQ